MKKLTIIAVALFSVLGLTANAQDNACCANAPQNKMYQPQEFTDFAFEGILLDINQQTRIDSLNAAVKANRPAQCPKMQTQDCKKAECPKADCKKADCKNGECPKAECPKADCKKADCKKGECTGECHGHDKGMKKGPKGRQACPYGDEYVAKVKEILTPEQYTVFLENIVSMPTKAPMMKGNHDGKGKKVAPACCEGKDKPANCPKENKKLNKGQKRK